MNNDYMNCTLNVRGDWPNELLGGLYP